MTDRSLAVPVIQAEIRARALFDEPSFWDYAESQFVYEPIPTLVERLR